MIKSQNGFTLVELAIALMVIGLLIGGVLKGQELIENAKVTSFIRQIKAYDTAVMIFRNTYGALPGDIKKPARIPNCNDAICNIRGNGNGKIERNVGAKLYESHNFFPHLTKAGMIQGPEGGAEEDMTVENVDMWYGSTAFDNHLGVKTSRKTYTDFANDVTERRNNYELPVFKEPMTDDETRLAFSKMGQIDNKMDDGKPFSGDVQVLHESSCSGIEDNEYYEDDSTNTDCFLLIHSGF